MANSIDFGTLCVGALVGIGCRKQIKSASRIAATAVASLASAAAIAANQAAIEANQSKDGQSAEEAAADQKKGK